MNLNGRKESQIWHDYTARPNERKEVMMIAQRMMGGDSEHIKILGTELKARGWEVSVVANWRPDQSAIPESFFNDVGLVTHSIEFPRPIRDRRLGLAALRAERSFSRLVRREKPNVVHAHARSVLPYCLSPSCPPVVFTKHLTGSTDPFSNISYRIAHRLIAISSELRQEMLLCSGLPEERVRLILHGIDSVYAEADRGDRVSLRRTLGLPERDLILVSVGRLDKQKDHSLTLRAVARLRGRYPGVHLVIVGDGPLHGTLAREISELKLRNIVTLAGRASPLPYLDAADVFVLSSAFEGFALAVAEAMMRGLPPVRTSTGGALDQIEPGVTGLLFRPGDDAGLVDAITLLASDPQLRAMIGNAARERAQERFTSAVMAEKTEAVYQEILDSMKNRR